MVEADPKNFIIVGGRNDEETMPEYRVCLVGYMFVCDLSVPPISYQTRHPARLIQFLLKMFTKLTVSVFWAVGLVMSVSWTASIVIQPGFTPPGSEVLKWCFISEYKMNTEKFNTYS